MTCRNPRRPSRSAVESLVELLESRTLFSSYDIVGVQAISLDQPQVHALFRSSPTGDPLGGTGPDDGVAIKAFLDTGASGVLLSLEAADAMGLDPITYAGQPVTFYDIGVAGAEAFDVSPAVYGALAPVRSLFEGEFPVSAFDQSFGPFRAQINQTPADPFFGGSLDVMGMPAIQGKVVVMDPTPLNATDPMEIDGMRTFVYSPGTPFDAANKATNPGIPTTNRHVKVSYGSFDRFTLTEPAGAPKPTLANNPFVGPNPARPAGTVDDTPGVGLAEGGKSVTGSFLLDTGAAASFVSQNIAAQLGVRYRAGTYASDNPILEYADGTPVPGQYVLPIGGIGGSVNAAGFRVDSLSLPTTEGEDIRFIDAPILVLDVSVEDPVTGQQLTLDGDLGMNLLVASASLDDSGGDDGGSAGAFDWVTFDQPNGLLGLNLPDAGPVTPPTTATIKGQLFHDKDADGTKEAGEGGIVGRTIYLDLNSSGTLDAGDRSTTTAADGSYTFANVTAGKTYRVRQVVANGWKASTPAGGYLSVTAVAGQTHAGRDFGTYTTGTVSGTLFNDANANGVRDGSEGVLAGWTVWVDVNKNGTRDGADKSAVTTSAGAYSIAKLDPGTYTVNLVKPSGWRQSTNAGKPLSATVASGLTVTGKNFGATKRAAVNGVAYNDADRDGVRDAAEAGLAGWKVYIDANKNGRRDTSERYVTTATGGTWAFNDLLAGTNYLIRIEQQTGWTRTVPSTGSHSITPTAGQVITKNFGQRRS